MNISTNDKYMSKIRQIEFALLCCHWSEKYDALCSLLPCLPFLIAHLHAYFPQCICLGWHSQLLV